MNPERWHRLEELFHAALEQPPGQRRSFLDAACGADDELRAEIERLLQADEQADAFVGSSTANVGRVAALLIPDGDHIGAYRIARELGRGGMGTVYLGERDDAQFEMRVAIKLIKRGMDTDSVLQRFRYERQILAGLVHPNIARLLDGGTTADGLPYFVLEYVDGEPIDDYCREPEADRRAAARSLPAGLRRRLLRPPAPGRPPRPQAQQHPRDRGRRAQAARFRHRQAARRR